MHLRNKLNVKQIAALTKPGVYSDGGGLYLRVRSTGSRSWLYVCRFDGRRREMGLGSFLDVTLAKAREKAAAARAIYLEGRDPVAERAMAQAAVAKPAVTFGAFATELLNDIEEGFRNDKHRKQWRATLSTHAAKLWDMPVESVDTQDVLAVLTPIWLTKNETASRLRGRIERVLDAARAKGLREGENPARWRGHLQLLLPQRRKTEVKHHAALPFAEVPALMGKLRKRQGMSARALEFAILTAARSGEVRGMTWGEVDTDNALWTVPGERMKAGHTHRVPLTERALALLASIKPALVSASDFVFPAERGGQMSDMAMSMLLRRMGHDEITVHGFRSSFRDWAGETTSFDREVIEMALAHTIESETERAYRRGRAVEKRRGLMNAWSGYCVTLSSSL